MRNPDPSAAVKWTLRGINKPKQERPDYITNEDIDAAMADAEKTDRHSLPMSHGVYLVMNRINRFVYVGRSNNIRHRVGVHFSQLKNRVHSNLMLLNDYRAYGDQAFGAAVLTHVLDEWSKYAERAALNLLKLRDCYNVVHIDYVGRANFSQEALAKFSPEMMDSRERMRKALTLVKP